MDVSFVMTLNSHSRVFQANAKFLKSSPAGNVTIFYFCAMSGPKH